MVTKLSVEEASRQKQIINELRQMVDTEFAKTGKRKSYKITTLGCQMNLVV